MAILVQSNKKPSVTFPSQTGNIVTFNSQYSGLPLKSCKVNIPVTQEGTGDPSPYNVRNFVGISSLDFTANSAVKTFQFGQTIYAGELDVLTGIFMATHGVVDLGSITYRYRTDLDKPFFQVSNAIYAKSRYSTFDIGNDKCSIYKTVSSNDVSQDGHDFSFAISATGRNIYIQDSRYTNANDYKTDMNGVLLVYELATPEIINLGGMDISTIQGENNLFASTGETTVEYIKIGG